MAVMNNIFDQTSAQLNRSSSTTYSKDYLGAVRLLENSGFSPYAESSSPLGATLNQVFTRFVEKTGLGTDASTLQNEFLGGNYSARRAMGLYSALENTFGSRGKGEQAAIVDFLNTKIDDYISTKDQNSDSMLTLEESELTPTLFEEADANRDSQLNAEEMRNNFYSNFRELNNVLDYFRSTPGILIDVYG